MADQFVEVCCYGETVTLAFKCADPIDPQKLFSCHVDLLPQQADAIAVMMRHLANEIVDRDGRTGDTIVKFEHIKALVEPWED